MRKIDKINKALDIAQLVGDALIVIGFIGVLGVAGTSDYENEVGQILHSFYWYVTTLIGCAGVSFLGILIHMASDAIRTSYAKAYYRYNSFSKYHKN